MTHNPVFPGSVDSAYGPFLTVGLIIFHFSFDIRHLPLWARGSKQKPSLTAPPQPRCSPPRIGAAPMATPGLGTPGSG